MADITLAEVEGRVWLVGGEPYIDDLLANTLAGDVSIEIVACEHKQEVMDLWLQHCGPQDFLGDPWLIHPNIVARIRRTQSGFAVFFAEWSARLDGDAMAVIGAAAVWAQQNPESALDLVEFLDDAGPRAIADLARLRASLIEDALIERGVAAARIGRTRRGLDATAGIAQESQRIDIAPRPPAVPG